MTASEKIKSRLSANTEFHSNGRYRYARDIAAPALAHAFNADRVWLFGSTASHNASDDSDIDLMVECKDDCLPIKNRLFLANEIVSSLAAPFDIDVIVLTVGECVAKSESSFMQSVIDSRRLIYG